MFQRPVFFNSTKFRDCHSTTLPQHITTFSQQYFMWWAKLLERDFINWINACQARPLAEDLFCGWHKTSKTMRAFLKCYQEIMSNRNLPVSPFLFLYMIRLIVFMKINLLLNFSVLAAYIEVLYILPKSGPLSYLII